LHYKEFQKGQEDWKKPGNKLNSAHPESLFGKNIEPGEATIFLEPFFSLRKDAEPEEAAIVKT
jgi:hypothetical protein